MKLFYYFLLSCFLFSLHAEAQNLDVIIIKDNGLSFPGPTGQTYDRWQTAANLMNYNDTAVAQTYLDSTAFLNTSKALVITNANLTNIDVNQLIAYAQTGRSVYIQTRDDTTSLGNKAFSITVNTLGGTFVWGKRFTSNFGRTVVGSLQHLPNLVMYCTPANVCNPITTTDWNGAIAQTISCDVVPFLFSTDASLSPTPPTATAWMYTPVNLNYGRIITATSTSWMTHGSSITNPAVVYPLMENMLYHLIHPHEGDTSKNKLTTVSQTICSSELPYHWNGMTVTAGGTAAAVFHGLTTIGCDSTVTLNLTVHPVYKDTVSFEICPGQLPFHWNGIAVNTTGIAVADFDTVTWLGCDSNVTLNLRLLPVFDDTLTDSICSVQLPYVWNGQTINNTGNFFLTYQTNSAIYGCDSTVHLNLTVLPTPDFQLTPKSDYVQRGLCIGDTITIWAAGSAVRYEWYAADSTLLTTHNPATLLLPQAANLFVVKGYNVLGCGSSKSISIDAGNCCGISIPSAFSPNGDGMNDGFGDFSIGHPTAYKLTVYNRFGQLMFTSFHINDQWDGTYKGVAVDAGTYFYMLSSQCADGSQYEHKGDVILIR